MIWAVTMGHDLSPSSLSRQPPSAPRGAMLIMKAVAGV
jgi:hypothetical protein